MTGAKYLAALGEERQVKAQQSVSSHLQEHARQNHGACGRRFRVRVRQPGVKREERDFDAEREGKRQKEPELAWLRARAFVPALSAFKTVT